MEGEWIDILIPTAGKRMNGLLFQIAAFLNQSYHRLTVWVLVDHDDFDLINAQ